MGEPIVMAVGVWKLAEGMLQTSKDRDGDEHSMGWAWQEQRLGNKGTQACRKCSVRVTVAQWCATLLPHEQQQFFHGSEFGGMVSG